MNLYYYRTIPFVYSILFLSLLKILPSIVSFTIPDQSITKKYNGETLIFWDEFKDELDLHHRWKPEISLSGFGNWEFQYYNNNRSTIYIKDQHLYIKPSLLPLSTNQIKDGYTLDIGGTDPASLCTGPQYWGCLRTSGAGGNYLNFIQSGRLRTAEFFNFKYGRIEITAKLPKGDYLWPALWLLPRYASYGPWPSSGEIDLMESRGNNIDYPPGGHNKFGSTLHVGPYYSGNEWPLLHKIYTHSESLHDKFHIYGLKWTPLGIKTYIDDPSNVVLDVPFTMTMFERGTTNNYFPSNIDNPWLTATNPLSAPFDQEFYLIMNVAVGGTSEYFPDGYGKPWSNHEEHPLNSFYNNQNIWYNTWKNDDTAMVIDSVYVWQDSNGLDGSTASGKWFEYAAAYGGLTVLPPSFKQIKNNQINYRSILPTSNNNNKGSLPGSTSSSPPPRRQLHDESTKGEHTNTYNNNDYYTNLFHYLLTYIPPTIFQNQTSLYIEIGLKNNSRTSVHN